MRRWLLHAFFRWAARGGLLDDVILWELPTIQAELDTGEYYGIAIGPHEPSVYLCHLEGGYVLVADLKNLRHAWVYADVLSEDSGLEIRS